MYKCMCFLEAPFGGFFLKPVRKIEVMNRNYFLVVDIWLNSQSSLDYFKTMKINFVIPPKILNFAINNFSLVF